MNTRFVELISTAPQGRSGGLATELADIVKAGIVERHGVFLPVALEETGRFISREGQWDSSYESAVSRLHVEDYITADLLDQTLAFIEAMLAEWNRCHFPGRYNAILTIGSDDYVLRFHHVRPGEILVAEDLEDFETEAVFECSSADLSFFSMSV